MSAPATTAMAKAVIDEASKSTGRTTQKDRGDEVQ